MDTGEEVLVDVVDDDGSPKRQPMSWVVEEIGRAVGEVREKGWMAVKKSLVVSRASSESSSLCIFVMLKGKLLYPCVAFFFLVNPCPHVAV